jgi:hypothetical protein
MRLLLRDFRGGARAAKAQNEHRFLAGIQGKDGADAGSLPVERVRRLEDEFAAPGGEDHRPAARHHAGGVSGAGIIEGGKALHAEPHRSADGARDAHDLPGHLLRLSARFAADRHEIGHLAHTLFGEETRHQNVGIGQVHLLDGGGFVIGSNPPVAALAVVQNRGEEARRIERRQAAPVDGAIPAHQRHRPHIADDAIVFDRQVAHCSW